MTTGLYKYLYNMKKYYYLILIIPVIIGIILSTITCKKETIDIPKDDSIEKIYQRQKEIQDSIYFKLKKENLKTIDSLNKSIKVTKEKSKKDLESLKKKYEKEYSKVINTPIDSTISISTKQLSEEIDYSKFQR